MTSGFDPYGQWFGISPRERPITLYRLLGLEPFESDAQVIAAAAAQRMQIARSHAAGPQVEAAKRVYRELVAARQCLINPESRAAYDAKLRAPGAQASKQKQPPAGGVAAGGATASQPSGSRPVAPPPLQAATATKKMAPAPTQGMAGSGATPPQPPTQLAAAPAKVRRQVPVEPPAVGLLTPPPAPPPPPPAPPPPAPPPPVADSVPMPPGGAWTGLEEIAAEAFVPKKSAASTGKPKRGAVDKTSDKRTAGNKKAHGAVKASGSLKDRRKWLLAGGAATLLVIVLIGLIVIYGKDSAKTVASAEQSDDAAAKTPKEPGHTTSDQRPAASNVATSANASAKTETREANADTGSADAGAANEGGELANDAAADAASPDAASPDAASPDAANPNAAILDLAQADGAVEPIQKAIEAGLDIETRDAAGRSLLRRAIMGGHQPLVEFLISKEANVNTADVLGETPLMSATQRGEIKLVGLLLNSDAKPDARTVADEENHSGGLAALHLAARAGNEEIVKALLEADADPNLRTAAGVTPLMIACWRQNGPIVLDLLFKKANAGAADVDKQTVLMYAVEGGDEDIVKQILARDEVKVSVKNNRALTALSIALALKSEELARILREAAKHEAPALDF